MSEYRYTSTEERVYADRALVVSPGDVVDWPDGPPADGHWEPTEETRVELERLAAEKAERDAAEKAAADAEEKAKARTRKTPPAPAAPKTDEE